MDGAGRRAERDRDGEGVAGTEARQHETGAAERGGEDGTRGWLREHWTGGGEVSEKTAEIIGRWLGRVQAVLLWAVAAALWVGVYFAAYFAVILMEEAK